MKQTADIVGPTGRIAAGAEPTALAFGPFRLCLENWSLTANGRPVALSHRAVRVLAALALRPGEVVAHDALIAAGWPGMKVLPDNLRIQIAGLRRALASGGLKGASVISVPGRGYQFVGAAASISSPPQPKGRRDLGPAVPAPLVRVIGRAESIEGLRDTIASSRLISVVGPGGVGKTTLALAAIHQSPFDRIWFVDLARAQDAAAALGAIAAATDGARRDTASVSALVEVFREGPGLLVLDNCEHLVPGCALLISQLLDQTDGLTILSTSRRPLQAEGEVVRRLYPLELPPRSTVTLAEAQTYPAAQLLVERITMAGGVAELTDADAPALVEICRRLDGLPLAIELAAGTVGMLGISVTAALLRDRMTGLREGRPTAPLRHRTLWATFAWSYDLLSGLERDVLRRVAFLSSPVPLDAIQHLCGDLEADQAGLARALGQLIEKSLIIVDVAGAVVRYSMLQTTRELARSATSKDEAQVISARHASLVMAA